MVCGFLPNELVRMGIVVISKQTLDSVALLGAFILTILYTEEDDAESTDGDDMVQLEDGVVDLKGVAQKLLGQSGIVGFR